MVNMDESCFDRDCNQLRPGSRIKSTQLGSCSLLLSGAVARERGEVRREMVPETSSNQGLNMVGMWNVSGRGR